VGGNSHPEFSLGGGGFKPPRKRQQQNRLQPLKKAYSMSTPKHRTAPSTSYLITTKCWQGRSVFQVTENADILIEAIFHYRDSGAYLLHEFVVMPDHLHFVLAPSATTSLEKAVQLPLPPNEKCNIKDALAQCKVPGA
jgi:hypothetical protein